MKVHLRALGFGLTGALRDYVGRRLACALGQFDHRLRRVEVMLSDDNGPRGGRDKRCLVRLVPEGLPAVQVTDRHEDLYAAIDRALDRAAHTLSRRKGRRVRQAHGRGALAVPALVGEG